MFKLCFADLFFFGGSSVKQILLSEKVYLKRNILGRDGWVGLVNTDMYESSHKEHVLVRKLFNNEALGQTTLNPTGYKNHSLHHVFQARVGGPAVYGSLHNNARLRDEVCLKKAKEPEAKWPEANKSSLALKTQRLEARSQKPEAKTRKQKLEQKRHKPGAEMSIGGSSDYFGNKRNNSSLVAAIAGVF